MSSPGKYRGIRVDNGKWVYGCKLTDCHGRCFIIKPIQIHVATEKTSSGGKDLYIVGCPEVLPETVGQYIGKKDMYHKEIYQGDICKNGDWEPDAHAYNYRIEEIMWDDGNAAWSGWNPNDDGMCCEVIGNVHEHPERLEEKQ